MLARALLLALTCLLAVACGSSTASPTPSGSAGASLAPASTSVSTAPDASVPSVNEQFCGTIADLESALQSFEAIKIRSTNTSKLKDAASGVAAALTPIKDTAAPNLTAKVASLKSAVDGLSGSTENYATSPASAQSAAGKKLKKAIATLHNAIAALRTAATCTN